MQATAFIDEALLKSVRGLFPGEVAVGLARIGTAGKSCLTGAESDGLEQMVPARQAEFIAGRHALRRAQAALGVAGFALPNGPDRAPIWPGGYCGSISHAGGLAMAVLGRCRGGLRSLGLDIEEDTELESDLHETVLVPAERGALHGNDDAGRRAKAIFCIKECVYKAQYPLSRVIFGFEAIEVRPHAASRTFVARFLTDIAPFRAGNCLQGRYLACKGLIVAGLALPEAAAG